MARDFDVTFPCPFCPEAELTATFEPGWDESGGPQMIELEGCEHAIQYLAGTLDPTEVHLMDARIDGAYEEAGREAQDAAEASRLGAYEQGRDEC